MKKDNFDPVNQSEKQALDIENKSKVPGEVKKIPAVVYTQDFNEENKLLKQEKQ